MKPREPDSYEGRFEHTALFEFSQVINSSLDLQFILSHILLTIMGKTLSAKGMVMLRKEDGSFVIESVKGLPHDFVGTALAIRKMPKSLVYVDRLNLRRYPWGKFFRQRSMKILLPMFLGDRPVGLLAFGERFSKRKLQAREETYLRSLANLSATAVEKNRIIEEVQQVNRKLDRKIQELNTLFDLGKEFGVMLDREKLVRLLVFSVLGQVGVSRYLVCLREGADMKIAASRIDGPPPQSEFLVMLSKIKTPTRVSELIVKQAVDLREPLQRMGLSVMIPMWAQGESKGVLVLGDKLSREPYSQADLEFLASLANLAIISLENARLFNDAIEKQKLEDELLIAREIQKGLLPSVLPEIPGVEIAASNISSKQVGGDYYDVIPLAGGRYVIAIGDVSGKGTPAALLMANLQATIRALVPLELSLSELTRRVNDLMCQNTGGDRFITFFWGIIDPVARTLTYVNAGHNLPFLARRDGTMKRLDKGGMILGVLKTVVPYEQESVDLRPGDCLLLFTDGVSEAMKKDAKEYGEDRLENTLRVNCRNEAKAIAEAVYRDIASFLEGAPQSDDITMMVVCFA